MWPNDLEHVLHPALGSGIIFTKFELGQPIRFWFNASFFAADKLFHTMTFTFDPFHLESFWYILCHEVTVCS